MGARFGARRTAELRQACARPHRRSAPASAPDERDLEALTGRELEVAQLVRDRKMNREIAATLFLSAQQLEDGEATARWPSAVPGAVCAPLHRDTGRRRRASPSVSYATGGPLGKARDTERGVSACKPLIASDRLTPVAHRSCPTSAARLARRRRRRPATHASVRAKGRPDRAPFQPSCGGWAAATAGSRPPARPGRSGPGAAARSAV
jgi:hypothetical protein